MTQCVKNVTKILSQMNKKMNVPEISRTLQEFQRQNAIMDQTGEMVEDAMADAFEEPDVFFSFPFLFSPICSCRKMKMPINSFNKFSMNLRLTLVLKFVLIFLFLIIIHFLLKLAPGTQQLPQQQSASGLTHVFILSYSKSLLFRC